MIRKRKRIRVTDPVTGERLCVRVMVTVCPPSPNPEPFQSFRQCDTWALPAVASGCHRTYHRTEGYHEGRH